MDASFAGVMISIANGGALSVLTGLLTLSGGWPSVDGKTFRDVPVNFANDGGGAIVATYSLGPELGDFVVRAAPGAPDGMTLQYTLRNVPAGTTIDSFGLTFDSVTGMKRYYQSGYHSWDGSSYVQPDGLQAFSAPQLALERSYALTQLIPFDPQGEALVMGFDRHERFQHTFSFGTRRSPADLAIVTWWDRKRVDPAVGAVSEKLWLLQDQNYEEGLRRWARIVAAASPTPPRVKNAPVIGWDSWYNLYNFIDERLIRESLESVANVVKERNLPMRTFLIDAGFTPELGDWLNTTYAFPNGMAPLLSSIKQAGFSPGLWIAPLLVGNRSQLYRAHPDWVLQEAKSAQPKLWASFYGEQRLGNMRSEEYFVLDTSSPEVLDYLRTVFRKWRREWGAEVFKIDFSFLGAEWGPDQVRYRVPGMTRIEVWRHFAEMVREEIGDDAIWIASGQPLWASVGLADTIRISGDVGVVWSGSNASAQPLLRDLPMRNFANHILWQADPDAVLLRNRYIHMTDTEVHSLALFAGMSGGTLMTSDNLSQLPPDRIALWSLLLSANRQNCSYPRIGRADIVYLPYQPPDGQPAVPIAFTDPVIVQVRSQDIGEWTVHIMNTAETELTRTFSLNELGMEKTRYVWDYAKSVQTVEPVSSVTLTIAAHASALLYMSPQPLLAGPGTLAPVRDSCRETVCQ